MTACPRAPPHRGGAAPGARTPRVRGVRRAARHRDPAGRLPARDRRSRRSASSPPLLSVSRATLREAMAALRAGRAGRDHPRPGRRHRRHAAAAHAVGAGRRRGSPPSGGATGSTRSSSARVVEPGAAALAARRRRRAGVPRATSSSRPTPTSARAERRGRAPPGGLPVPPHPGRVAGRTHRADRGGHVRAGDAARDAAGDPGARAPTSPTPTGSTRPGRTRRSSPATPRPRPPGHGGTLRRHGRAAARPGGLTRGDP